MATTMIYFYHIRKTGGRSLVLSYLSRFASGEDLDILWARCFGGHGQTSPIIEIAGRKIAPWNSSPPHDVDFSWAHTCYGIPDLPANVCDLTILRDPVQRFISLYRNLRRHEDQPKTGLLRKDGKWLGENIVATARNMPPAHRYEILQTFSPSHLDVATAVKNIKQLCIYLRLEDFEAGLQKLRQYTYLPFPLFHYRETHRDDIIRARLTRELTPEVIADLVVLFEPEYQLLENFGYTRPQ